MPETKSMAANGQTHNPTASKKESGRGRAARGRAMIYSILAQALACPGEALCSGVAEGAFSALLGYALAEAPAGHRRAIEADLVQSFTAGAEGGTFATSILIEYTRLFSANLHCLQYEADYLARNSDNSVHVIAAIAGFYSTFGVRLAESAGERPDHIAAELDFMNFLAAKEAHAGISRQTANARLCRRAQVHFFGRHLSRWGSLFAGNLAEATTLPFYRSTCELLTRFLAAEAEYLGIEPFRQDIQAEAEASEKCGCSHCTGTSPEQSGELVQLAGPIEKTMREAKTSGD